MSDNLDKLFKAARAARPDTSRVEFGFETRLLARLRAERTAESPWYAFAWRLTPVFAALVLGLGAWTMFSSLEDTGDFRQAIVGRTDESLLVSSLTGE